MRMLISGSVAAVASTLALVWLGRRELNDAAAPVNGPSQWIWGRSAPYQDGFSARHTLVGYGIHHSASMLWAALYERLRRAMPGGPRQAALAAAATAAATAYVVDFKLTPERFTPGYEKRLSKRGLYAVYAAFALGLAVPALVAPPLRRDILIE